MHSLFFSASETSNQYKPSFYNMSFHMEGHSTEWSLLYWNQNCKPQWSPLHPHCGLCLSMGTCQWLPNLILSSHWFLICVTWVWAMNSRTPCGLLFLLSFTSDSAIPWTAGCRASLSFTISQSLFKFMSIESMMPSKHPILCHPLLLLPSIFLNIRVFSVSQLFASGGQNIGVSAWTSVLPMNTKDWFPLWWTGWISLQSTGLLRVFSNTTVQKHQFFGAQLSSQSNSHTHTWPLEKP